jgi:hypothetical protein
MNEQQQPKRNKTCLEAGQLIAWRDGALPVREANEVLAHLAVCAHCTAEDRALMRDRRQVVDLLSRVDPPPDAHTEPAAALARFQERLTARSTGSFLDHYDGNIHSVDFPPSRSDRQDFLPIQVRPATPIQKKKGQPLPVRRHPRLKRLSHFAQTLAAVLVVCLILSGFMVLFAWSHSRLTGMGSAQRWCLVRSASPGTRSNSFSAVAALSTNDVWAVGSYSNNLSVSKTLIEHWDGQQWAVVASPDPGRDNGILYGVATVSAHDVWAVGTSYTNNGANYTLIEHWDGKQWKVVPSPNLQGGQGNELDAIAAVSAHDVWAVGKFYVGDFREQPLIEHWNGANWSIVPAPNPGQLGSELHGVTALSANDIWAVGISLHNVGASKRYRPVILHWNGTVWSVSVSPNVPQGIDDSELIAVAGASSTDIWAAGFTTTMHVVSLGAGKEGSRDITRTLIEHWDGIRWGIVSSPTVGTFSLLRGVTAISPSDVWAVGDDNDSRGTLVEHWDGTSWSVVASPNAAIVSPNAAMMNSLYGVVAVSGHQIWAVGDSSTHTADSDSGKTLVESFCS